MFARLAHFVTRHWMLVIVLWLVAVFGVRLIAPRWESITHDGDFAYLPPQMASVVGEQWMTEAFPWQRGRSQVVIAIARDDEPLTNDDIQVAYDVGRRLKDLFGAARLAEARRLSEQEGMLRRENQIAAAEAIHQRFRNATAAGGRSIAGRAADG